MSGSRLQQVDLEPDPYAPVPLREARFSPLSALARRWPLAVVLVAAGMGLGVLAASLQPTEYTAEARVAVGYGDLSSGAIAGFPVAASQLASNYARYVNDQSLADGGTGAVLDASPIPASNVVRIEVTDEDAALARTTAAQAATDLVALVNNPPKVDGPAAVFGRYKRAATTWATRMGEQSEAQEALETERNAEDSTPAQLAARRADLAAADAATAVAALRKDTLAAEYQQTLTSSDAAELVVVQDAEVVSDDSTSRMARFGLLGLVLGVAVALVIAVALERRRARRSRYSTADLS